MSLTQHGQQRNSITNQLPSSLLNHEQWVCWKSTLKNKLPVNPHSDELASVNSPDDWAKYQTAYDSHCQSTNVDGIGFVFTEEDPFVGIDLDGCYDDGTLSDLAHNIVDTFSSSAYIEVSPSGEGIHIITQGDLPEGRNQGDSIEMYDTDRYFTVTGDTLPQSSNQLTSCQGKIRTVYQNYIDSVNNCSEAGSELYYDISEPPIIDEELVNVTEEALRDLQIRSTKHYNDIMHLIRGERTDLDIPKKEDGKVDRSAANFVALSQLSGILSTFTDLDGNERVQAASSTLSRYCREHPSIYDGQRRRWTTDTDQYRSKVWEAVEGSFDQLAFNRSLRKKSNTRNWSGRYSEVTYDIVAASVFLLNAGNVGQGSTEKFAVDTAKTFVLDISRPNELTNLLVSTTNNHLKIITLFGDDVKILWKPCRQDITKIAQAFDPDLCANSVRQALTHLQQQSQIKMAKLPRQDRYQNVYYPASRRDPQIADYIRIGGDDYRPDDAPSYLHRPSPMYMTKTNTPQY